MDDSKPFWKSKTLWTNAIVALLGLVSSDTVAEHPTAAAGLVALVNVILRLVTKGGVSIA